MPLSSRRRDLVRRAILFDSITCCIWAATLRLLSAPPAGFDPDQYSGFLLDESLIPPGCMDRDSRFHTPTKEGQYHDDQHPRRHEPDPNIDLGWGHHCRVSSSLYLPLASLLALVHSRAMSGCGRQVTCRPSGFLALAAAAEGCALTPCRQTASLTGSRQRKIPEQETRFSE